MDGFDLPVRVTVAEDRYAWIEPVTGAWRTTAVRVDEDDFRVDPAFYVDAAEARE